VNIPVVGALVTGLPDEVEPPPPPVEPPPVDTGMRVNVADTDLAPVTVVVHDPVPVHTPPHPVNVESADGVAVRVMVVPDVTDMEQVEPQFKPLPVIVPVPVPDLDADTVYVVTGTEAVVMDVGRERDDSLPAASYADTVNV
jgi:hypothetical protein